MKTNVALISVITFGVLLISAHAGWRLYHRRVASSHAASVTVTRLASAKLGIQGLQAVDISHVDHLSFEYDQRSDSVEIYDRATIARLLNVMRHAVSVDDCCGLADVLTVNFKPAIGHTDDPADELVFIPSAGDKVSSLVLPLIADFEVSQSHRLADRMRGRVRRITVDDKTISDQHEISRIVNALKLVGRRAFDYETEAAGFLHVTLMQSSGAPVHVNLRFRSNRLTVTPETRSNPLPDILWQYYSREIIASHPE
jgi:hypothetical protein